MIVGDPKYTGLHVGEFSCNMLGNTVKLTAKAAFVDPRGGTTHGWTQCDTWSPETMEKMREFIGSMESDLARQHFTGFSPAAGALDVEKPKGISTGGLGEHLSGDGDQV